MDLWHPPSDQPHLLEWWRPLLLASRAARLDRVPWPIHLDDFALRGRVDRAGRPDVWIYAHPGAGELYLDSTGQPYRFTRTPKAKGYGRFTGCDIRMAIWRAGLPEVVEPIWFADEVPSGPPAWVPAPEVDPVVGTAHPSARHATPGPPAVSPPEPRRHGHLIVHDGGRPLAG